MPQPALIRVSLSAMTRTIVIGVIFFPEDPGNPQGIEKGNVTTAVHEAKIKISIHFSPRPYVFEGDSMLCPQCVNNRICQVYRSIEEKELVGKIDISNCEFFIEFIEEEPLPVEEKEPYVRRPLIVAHGDLDGILSAAALMIESPDLAGTRTIFGSPAQMDFVVNEIEKGNYNEIYVCDIAPNNKNPDTTRHFIEHIDDRLKAWYDHHKGWSDFYIRYLDRYSSFSPEEVGFHFDENAVSCAELITDNEFIVNLAREADTGGENLSSLGTLLNTALKYNTRDYYTKYEILTFVQEYVEKGDIAMDSGIYHKLRHKSIEYRMRLSNTYELLEKGKVIGNVLVFENLHGRVDVTRMLMRAYERRPFVVLKTSRASGKICNGCHNENPPVTDDGRCGICNATLGSKIYSSFVVGTNSGINLLRVFNLESGAPYRISIHGGQLKHIVDRLNEIQLSGKPRGGKQAEAHVPEKNCEESQNGATENSAVSSGEDEMVHVEKAVTETGTRA